MKIITNKNLTLSALAIAFSSYAFFAPTLLKMRGQADCPLTFSLLGQPCAAFYNIYLLPILLIVSFSFLSYFILRRIEIKHPMLIPLASHTLMFLCLKFLVWREISLPVTLTLLALASVAIMFATYYYFDKWRASTALKVILMIFIVFSVFLATPIAERLIYSTWFISY